MLPLAIIAAALVISLAAGIIYQDNQKKQKSAQDHALEAKDLLEKAMAEGKIQAAAMPGLEGRILELTTHIAQFEQVVDPKQDLNYGLKLAGEIEPEFIPVGEAPPISEDDRLKMKAYAYLTRGIQPGAIPPEFRSPQDPATAAETLSGQGTAGYTTLAVAHTPGIIAEAAGLGQIEGVMWTIQDLLKASGLPDIVHASAMLPYEIAVLGPAKYHYNRVYRPTQPGAREIPMLLARGIIDEADYLRLMSYHGYDESYASWLLNIFYRLPDVRDLNVMRWRGILDDVGFKDTLLKLGWHPDVIDEMLNLAWQIPGPGDLIRFVVREVIPPSEFIDQMGKQGYGPGWAGAYWTAHFRLPGTGDLIEAFHRGFISEAELKKYFFWHDYAPDPRPDIRSTDIDIYKSLTKRLIPRVDLRRAWRQGELSDAELEERYRWLGYEEDAPLMARLQKAIALTAERGSLAKLHLAGLRKGVISESAVRAQLKKLRIPGPAIDLLIETEYVRRDIGILERGEEQRILSTSQILTAYKKGLFTWDVTREILTGQGWRAEDAEILLTLNTPPPEEERPISQVRTAAAALYKEGFMSAEEFEGRLRAANYSEADITTIRTAEDLRYRLDYVKDLESAAITAYREDIYTAEELTDYLITLGLNPERVAPLVSKEVFKKLPKARPA